MQKLFFELIQVSLGQLDCLERGPSEQEWAWMYEQSQHHGLTALCYEGVVKLFEFGLRAPQDVSIDWMAAAEDSTVQSPTLDVDICNPLRKMLFQRWQERNGNTLYVKAGGMRRLTPSAALVAVMVQAFEQLNRGELTLRAVTDCYRVLRQADGALAGFSDGSTVEQMLRTLGLWRFTRAMMWMVGEVTALDARLLVCSPAGSAGRFLLGQVMGGRHPLTVRIKNRLKKFLLF